MSDMEPSWILVLTRVMVILFKVLAPQIFNILFWRQNLSTVISVFFFFGKNFNLFISDVFFFLFFIKHHFL